MTEPYILHRIREYCLAWKCPECCHTRFWISDLLLGGLDNHSCHKDDTSQSL